MTLPRRPTPDQIALAPELGILAALEAVLDLSVRTLEAAWPEPRSADDDESLASRITQLADELREAIVAYRDLVLGPDLLDGDR
jgi:hypothetical protein